MNTEFLNDINWLAVIVAGIAYYARCLMVFKTIVFKKMAGAH